MAWILRCILWVSLFQITTQYAPALAEGRSVREGERAANQKSNVDDKVVFPGEYEKSKPLAFEKPLIPEECKEVGICEDIPNYPEYLVKTLIHDLMRQNRTRFNKDMLDVPQIAQRIGPEDDYVELCETEERIYAPRAAQDTNMEWHVIVNDKKQPQQTFRVEICKAKESPCSAIAYFQNGYKAKCVQKYMLRNMLAVTEQKVVVEKPFQVPSCCSCVARQT
ncbi:protein spaetzle-like isoform X2 [Pararge aegeria]|uniref:Jg16226 protein n=1 Tax=Pararge aegeria aegeria TaxID=348720 RepID=A0A8S4RW95_9NEOP|nr:protein spaetzle-like isoform X2 [Pararge aegeria]CAH2241834.1 jg16226 [Pararge aegeria aegeria]